jgi:hypothetical protein
MSKPSERDYRPSLRRQAQQLLEIAKTIRDPAVRERVERLAMDVAAECEGGDEQIGAAKPPRLA